MKAKVIRYQQNKKNQNPIAVINFYIEDFDFFLYECRLIENKEGELFISFPSRKYRNEQTGEDRYMRYCLFGEKNKDLAQKALLEAVQEFLDDPECQLE
jgi:DNA-binding cell septation regulator SpoVG